jgi:hypothetical protein
VAHSLLTNARAIPNSSGAANRFAFMTRNMRKLGAVLTLVGGLALSSATPAFANGFQSYRICGGNTFSTCAAVEVSVIGQTWR